VWASLRLHPHGGNYELVQCLRRDTPCDGFALPTLLVGPGQALADRGSHRA